MSFLREDFMKKKKIGYIFIAPYFLVFTIFGLYPILLSLYLSFTNFKGVGSPYDATFVGLSQYKRLFTDTYFFDAFMNTWKIWGMNIIVQLVLAMILAVIFSDIRMKMKGVSLFRAIFYLPNLITISSVALLYLFLLDWQHGPVNMMLLKFNIINEPIYWFGRPLTAQISVAMIQTWMWFGHTFIIMLAGMQGISKEYYEAAMVDGASRLHMFKDITIPLLKPVLVYIAITSLIGGLQLFELPFLVSDNGLGGPDGSLVTMVLYLYNQAFKYHNVGYAAAVAYGLFAIILAFSLIVYRTMFKEAREDR